MRLFGIVALTGGEIGIHDSYQQARVAHANDLQDFIHVQVVQAAVQQHLAPVFGLQFCQRVGAPGGLFHFGRFIFRFSDPKPAKRFVRAGDQNPRIPNR
jgi:hypothetical protein